MLSLFSRPALPDGATIRVRLYKPEDREQVVKTFRSGMLSLAQAGMKEVLHNREGLQLLSCVVPAAVFLMTPKRCGLGVKAAAGLGAAAIVPAVVYGTIRHMISQYVAQSLGGDLRDIGVHYSASGAGHGSAFWVAELLEPIPAPLAPPTPPSPPAASASPAAPAPSTPEPQEPAVAAGSARAGDNASETAAVAESQETAQAPTDAAAASGDAAQQSAAQPEAQLDGAGAAPAVSEPAGPSGVPLTPEEEVRRLVRGIVASAVARLEASAATTEAGSASSSSTEPAPAATASKTAPQAPAPVVAPPSPAPAPPPAAAKPAPPVTLSTRWSVADLTSMAAPSPAAAAAAAAPPRYRSTVIGCVGLERKTWQVAELRRMSVAPRFRRLGVGRRLLETLVRHARDNGFKELVLTTSSLQAPARRLYERGGWAETEVKEDETGFSFHTYKIDLIKKR